MERNTFSVTLTNVSHNDYCYPNGDTMCISCKLPMAHTQSATVNAEMKLRCFSVLLTYFILIRRSPMITLGSYWKWIQKVEMSAYE